MLNSTDTWQAGRMPSKLCELTGLEPEHSSLEAGNDVDPRF